jgi:polar amino acid transport system substrate-binding protein
VSELKFKFFVGFLLIFLFCFGQEQMNLATDCYEPFYGPELKNKGVITELASEALKVEGLVMNVDFVPWQRAYVMAKDGKYHGLLGALYTKERKDYFLCSEKIFDISIGLFAKKKKGINYKKLEDLKRYKIGVVRGYNYTDEFDNANYLNKVESSTAEKSVNLFINDRVDIIAGPKMVIECYIKKEFSSYEEDIEYIGELEVRPLHILISKKLENSDYYIKKLDDGLKKIKENGVYEKIIKKHGVF